MRFSHAGSAPAIIVLLLVIAACSSSATPVPSSSPSSSPSASRAPTPTARPSATPDTVVEPMLGRIAAGYQFACVVTDAGGVKCWGANGSGQLGNGTTAETPVPGVVDVVGLPPGIVAIAAGEFHACALTNVGGVKCWGNNFSGQLGNGSNGDASVPVDVLGLSSGVVAISGGNLHSCALTTAGAVKCWGSNGRGQLGNGSTADSNVPVPVVGLGSGAIAVAAGSIHTCALLGTGGVRCWGFGPAVDPSPTNDSYVPIDVAGIASRVTVLSAALDRTCGLLIDGRITCWGPTYAGPIGDGPRDWMFELDNSGLSSQIAAFTLADSNACALTRTGGVGCWGTGSSPVEVAGLASGVAEIAVGGTQACALLDGGEVKCWGSNSHGQLGAVLRCSSSSIPVDVRLDGTVGPVPTPEPIRLPAGPLEHATGATDVLFRFDRGPDFAVGDLVGELFQPGPEFTLYGDGTVIFRDDVASNQPPPSRIVRSGPFMIAQLAEDRVQAFLRFALDAGGLWSACETYPTQDTDISSWDIFDFNAAGIDKRFEDAALAPLREYIVDFGRSNPTAAVWAADRYWGSLLDASVFKGIGDGTTPGLAESGSVAWPWPGIAPTDFVGRDEGGWIGTPRRVMTAEEASVLGLSDNGGVVQRVYLRGPDGKTIYYFSLWPMSPDEPG